MAIKWCCHYFENMFGSKGHRGFSIILKDNLENIPIFFTQFRSIESGDEKGVKSDKALSLEGSVAISFCPSCGKNLRKYYRKYIVEMKQNPPVVLRNE
jgi:hypothetical protein